MFTLPFSIPKLSEFMKYLVHYKGIDLSFLKGKIERSVNQWATPYYEKTIDDRELELVFKIPSRSIALSLAEKVLANPVMFLTGTGDLSEYMSKIMYDGMSWDDFEKGISVNLRFFMETGLTREKLKSGNVIELRREETPSFFTSPLEWRINVLSNRDTAGVDTDLKVSWIIGNKEGADAPAYIRYESGDLNVHCNNFYNFKYDSGNINQGKINNDSIAMAFKNGLISYTGNIMPDASLWTNSNFIQFKVSATPQNNLIVDWTFVDRRILI